jgi:hypothetical protein
MTGLGRVHSFPFHGAMMKHIYKVHGMWCNTFHIPSGFRWLATDPYPKQWGQAYKGQKARGLMLSSIWDFPSLSTRTSYPRFWWRLIKCKMCLDRSNGRPTNHDDNSNRISPRSSRQNERISPQCRKLAESFERYQRGLWISVTRGWQLSISLWENKAWTSGH